MYRPDRSDPPYKLPAKSYKLIQFRFLEPLGVVAQVVEFGAAHAGLLDRLDFDDAGRAEREDLLDADARADLADSDGGAGGAAAVERDDDALEDLDAFLLFLARD